MLLYAQLLILVVLAVLNIWFGLDKGLYDTIWWWDIPTHFLGGVWAGTFVSWVLQRRNGRFDPVRTALGALCIGIIWEVFEYMFNIGSNSFMPYWADTLKDLVMDTLGGALAGYAALLQKDLWRK